MEKVLRTIEKFIPKKVYHFFQPAYHYGMTLLGAIIYGFPAKKLYIVGITGTKGKTSTTEIVNAILEASGKKTAFSNSIRFKIGDKIRINKFKMSMPGRFFMQKFLSDAVKAGCTHAVIEMTSEGSKMFRHKFIWLDAFIFTNLAPEHIESHGSYAKYLQAKLNLADNLNGPKKNTLLIVNGDDIESEHFLEKKADKKVSYSLSNSKPLDLTNGVKMRFGKNTLYSPLLGEFNAYNILAAATFAKEIGISDETIKDAVENLKQIPGRAQKIEAGQNFEVYVDYAHTKESLEALYKSFPNKNKVCVLGNCGGGRDKWKRPEMAKIAEQYCDEIILTDEDPYNEDPNQIVNEMKNAITKKTVTVIMDRRAAINKGLEKAKLLKNAGKESVVLITGKGTDPYIMGPNGTKTPWLDSDVALEEIKKVIS
jgi:UDP-N-acetylmuramoyl-L-alanyl-D-glutamate--2,6-diaminopimelate ligase